MVLPKNNMNLFPAKKPSPIEKRLIKKYRKGCRWWTSCSHCKRQIVCYNEKKPQQILYEYLSSLNIPHTRRRLKSFFFGTALCDLRRDSRKKTQFVVACARLFCFISDNKCDNKYVIIKTIIGISIARRLWLIIVFSIQRSVMCGRQLFIAL